MSERWEDADAETRRLVRMAHGVALESLTRQAEAVRQLMNTIGTIPEQLIGTHHAELVARGNILRALGTCPGAGVLIDGLVTLAVGEILDSIWRRQVSAAELDEQWGPGGDDEPA